MKHLYPVFWRPDWLEKLQANNQTQAALCELVVHTRDMTAVIAETDCPACRDTFLEALPTGNGKRKTFNEYLLDVAHEQKQRAADQAKRIAANNNRTRDGWSTDKPDITQGWSTNPDTGGGWRT